MISLTKTFCFLLGYIRVTDWLLWSYWLRLTHWNLRTKIDLLKLSDWTWKKATHWNWETKKKLTEQQWRVNFDCPETAGPVPTLHRLSKAFNRVPHDLLWEKLIKMKCHPDFVRVLKDLNKDSYVTVLVNPYCKHA